MEAQGSPGWSAAEHFGLQRRKALENCWWGVTLKPCIRIKPGVCQTRLSPKSSEPRISGLLSVQECSGPRSPDFSRSVGLRPSELSSVLRVDLEEWGGGVVGGGRPRREGHVYSWFPLVYNRNEYNIIKQLYSNNKISNKVNEERREWEGEWEDKEAFSYPRQGLF